MAKGSKATHAAHGHGSNKHDNKARDDQTDITLDESLSSSGAYYESGEGSESSSDNLSDGKKSNSSNSKSSSSSKIKKSSDKDKNESNHKHSTSSRNADKKEKDSHHLHHHKKESKSKKDKQEKETQISSSSSSHRHHSKIAGKGSEVSLLLEEKPDYNWGPTYHWEKHQSSSDHPHKTQQRRRSSEADVLTASNANAGILKRQQRHSLKVDRRFQKLVNNDDDSGLLFASANDEEGNPIDTPVFPSHSKHQPQQQQTKLSSKKGAPNLVEDENEGWDEEEQDMEEDEALRTSSAAKASTNAPTSPKGTLNGVNASSGSPRRHSLTGRLPTSSNLPSISFISAYLVDKVEDGEEDEEDEDALAEQVIQNPSQAYAPHSPKHYHPRIGGDMLGGPHHGRGSPGSPPFAGKNTIGPEVLGDEEFTVPEALGLDEGIPEINHQRYAALL